MAERNRERVIEPGKLRTMLERDDVLVLDLCRPELYAQAHVPGAVHVSPAEIVSGVSPATGRLPPTERLTALMRRVGYRPDLEVIVYDDEGGGWAGRMGWILDVIGHDAWSYLDGGIHAWSAAAMPLEEAMATPAPTTVDVELHPGPIAEIGHILPRLGDDDMVLWDARSPEEYRGERVSAERGGHIPGARNIDWQLLKDPARHYRLIEDPMALLGRHGITPDRDVVVYCQTHHRSGLAYLVARQLEFPRIRAYHGSWSEWGNRSDLPVETGG